MGVVAGAVTEEVSEKDETSPGLPSLQMGVFEERAAHTPGMHWVSRFFGNFRRDDRSSAIFLMHFARSRPAAVDRRV